MAKLVMTYMFCLFYSLPFYTLFHTPSRQLGACGWSVAQARGRKAEGLPGARFPPAGGREPERQLRARSDSYGRSRLGAGGAWRVTQPRPARARGGSAAQRSGGRRASCAAGVSGAGEGGSRVYARCPTVGDRWGPLGGGRAGQRQPR